MDALQPRLRRVAPPAGHAALVAVQVGLQAGDQALRVDPLQAEPIVDALVEMDWLARLDEPGSARYVLLVDPAATPAAPLLAQMLLEPTPMLRAFRERAGFDRLTLAELLQG